MGIKWARFDLLTILSRISGIAEHETYCVVVIYSPGRIQKTCSPQRVSPAKRCQFLKDCAMSWILYERIELRVFCDNVRRSFGCCQPMSFHMDWPFVKSNTYNVNSGGEDIVWKICLLKAGYLLVEIETLEKILQAPILKLINTL